MQEESSNVKIIKASKSNVTKYMSELDVQTIEQKKKTARKNNIYVFNQIIRISKFVKKILENNQNMLL